MSDQTLAVDGRARKAIHGLSRALGLVSVLIISVMMVSTVADVASRLIAGKSIPGVIEMGEVLMVTSVFLGLAFAESRGAHVNMTFIVDKLSPKVAAIANSLGWILVLLILGWMIIVTGDRALASIEMNEYRFGLVKIPVWPGRLAIVIGLASYFLEIVPRLFMDIKKALR